MSEYILSVPATQRAADWFVFVSESLSEIGEFDQLIVDFNTVRFMETDDFVLLACLIESFYANGCEVSIDRSNIVACSKVAVELIDYKGAVETAGNYLTWMTASETDNDHFTLEHSIDGVNFIDTTQTAKLPTDVYQNGNDYVGLSTPSPVLIGDTIYLFTDVAQNIFGDWMQVALHQFKSYGDITKWYHDTLPIHTRSDFPWTDGNFSGEIRSITPLLDGDRLRIWFAGHNISSIDTAGGTNDTTYNAFFIGGIGGELHVNPGFWGIGTSEYVFPNITGVDEETVVNENIGIQYYQNKGVVTTNNTLPSIINIYSVSGQLLYRNEFTNSHNFNIDYNGLILINITNENSVITKKYISSK